MQDITYGFDHIKQPLFIWKERFQVPRNMMSNHYHDAYEIYYLLEGERDYFIKGRTYHIQKGDLILIDVNELHKTMDVSAHERILLNFRRDFLPAAFQNTLQNDLFSCFHQDNNLLRLNTPEQDFVRDLLMKMLAENEAVRSDSMLYLQALLTELLIFLNRLMAQKSTGDFLFPNSIHQKISEIVVYMTANYQENITLGGISERFEISKYYLSRMFKEVTGFTLIEYLNGIRTKQAQKMLRTTALNVTTISENVGFDSITHFGRVFKTITGSSPLQYRKALRKD